MSSDGWRLAVESGRNDAAGWGTGPATYRRTDSPSTLGSGALRASLGLGSPRLVLTIAGIRRSPSLFQIITGALPAMAIASWLLKWNVIVRWYQLTQRSTIVIGHLCSGTSTRKKPR